METNKPRIMLIDDRQMNEYWNEWTPLLRRHSFINTFGLRWYEFQVDYESLLYAPDTDFPWVEYQYLPERYAA
jgi:hypothetical protein